MNCQGLEARPHAYVDRELPVATAGADAHVAGRAPCAAAAGRERHFRQLLRLAVPAVTVAAAVMIALFVPGRASAPLLEPLVSKHVAFAQLKRPAELTTSDRHKVALSFQERADGFVSTLDDNALLADRLRLERAQPILF